MKFVPLVILMLSLASFADDSSCNFASKKLYTPQEAMNDINSSTLTYIGRAILPKHDKNSSCIFKSDRAYIIYHNCMSNKNEYIQTDIDVISFNGNIVNFNIFNSGKIPGQKYSQLTRKEYDYMWRVSVTKSPKPGNLNINQLKTYLKKAEYNKFCTIGSMGKAQDMSSKVYCDKGISDASWIAAGENFWKNPGSRWYESLSTIRAGVMKAPF